MDELNTAVANLDIKDSDVVVKRKKGRPRKDTSNVQDAPKQPEEKKKRGRKKKEVVVEEVKQKKKRGRKAAVKYFSSSIRKKIPLTTVLQDNDNYILHLDVKDNDVDKLNENETNDLNIDAINVESKTDFINTVFENLKKENDVNLLEYRKNIIRNMMLQI